ncbi:MAG: sulfate adenylyltransferase subunit CysN [Bacteroidota bacterium]|jgi:sulfate adenylyltransferase subunit 1|uniref:sulfate adenylyltransferase subunit CysN n=1 Tax=Candidatus Pollutiaquabacter sp. TaxID=3416354 RepID=UPI001B725E00|nr:sulfate adenylyltransferase subunit CysN [Bacteroidota bacterium]MBP7269783.1 sulfate adenylyltransferase subunit CysN [Bacteroidia bacterium]MBP7436475.1 sulfate adenylyltransferase subunit CysN [Bacteroidia bacterium]MBP7727939.1 sulfate adenylyltransferase subunit CysN [Bacteroidia bacterium]MBP7771720.1 sulfate adenylyltransferase subunit CysN [Bacteroidia bacterium]
MANRGESELLRFTTAGSVDDGKSTLIGRLLLDTRNIFDDQLAAIESTSKQRGFDYVDLSLFTDGLKAEREQGITIDVAYRYFATAKRKFIIADTPGHRQYTRNMVTGASTANLALILIDARKGILEQTCRHAFIASLLRIPHMIVCVNKMDLVDYNQETYDRIVEAFRDFSSRLDIQDVQFVPISALKGDNVVERSNRMPWYEGSTLLYHLENVHISGDINHVDCRFPVQYVIRPQQDDFHDYRGYAGRLAAGVFREGDRVMVLPSGFTSRIASIDTYEGQVQEAFAPMSVSIRLEDDIDISRGDMIVRENNVPQSGQDLDVMLCWLHERPMQAGGRYVLMHTTREARCIVKDIRYKIDITTLRRLEQERTFGMNDIGRVQLRTTVPLSYDSYRRNRLTGSLILIDEHTNETVGAAMIL